MSHVRAKLRSEQGMNISIEGELEAERGNSNKPWTNLWGKNVTITADGAGLKLGARVRAVLQNISDFQGNSNSNYARRSDRKVHFVDLEHVGGDRFAARLPEDLLLHNDSYAGVTDTHQKVALVVNGEWQRDPLQPGAAFNDFNLDLERA